jgi:hypothetical protein
MKLASEYRQHAAECRALAAAMPQHDQRDQLLQMAETWDRMAEERERLVKASEPESFAPEPSPKKPACS